MATWILSIVIGSLLAFSGAGCHKKAADDRPQTLEDGMTRLGASLITASPEVQSNLYNRVSRGIRYGNYSDASLGLQQIASDPSLNDQQKKLVNDVSGLLKQAENQRNAPKPAQ